MGEDGIRRRLAQEILELPSLDVDQTHLSRLIAFDPGLPGGLVDGIEVSYL